MAEVYALYSSRDGVVRYVGQTGGDCSDRFKQHQRQAERRWAASTLKGWFHSEWKAGYLVKCARCLTIVPTIRAKRVKRSGFIDFPTY
jgi:hypothetical protein